LVVLSDLVAERGGEYVPAYRLSARLGKAPGLGRALEQLLEHGLIERGPASAGGWGDRPTEAGYASLAQRERFY
jgi:hypothetical protein